MQSVAVAVLKKGAQNWSVIQLRSPSKKMPVENTSKPNQGDGINAADANFAWETQSTSVIDFDNPPDARFDVECYAGARFHFPSVLCLVPNCILWVLVHGGLAS